MKYPPDQSGRSCFTDPDNARKGEDERGSNSSLRDNSRGLIYAIPMRVRNGRTESGACFPLSVIGAQPRLRRSLCASLPGLRERKESGKIITLTGDEYSVSGPTEKEAEK
jgi:hypothetical protein